jgi:hypothetical protein
VPLGRTRNLVDREAASEAEAVALLPSYVAERTTADRVTAVDIP